MDIQGCKIFSSTTMQGVCAQGKGSAITLKNSKVHGRLSVLFSSMFLLIHVNDNFLLYLVKPVTDCLQTCVVSLNGNRFVCITSRIYTSCTHIIFEMI
jgi:hypothetical protein